jgi:light-regulated signal transduction histidine kinase (bacteriophytochrome)
MVTAFDTNLNYTYVNKRARDFVHGDMPDPIGRNVLEVQNRFEDADQYEHLQRALRGEVVHVEARKPSANANVVLETFVLPLKHNDKITGVLTLQRDVTAIIRLTEDLKRLNADLRRSNEDLQQFAHVTSHDLKEPVRKIRTYADLLRSGFGDHLPEKALAHIAKIENSTSRVSNMIDGILQYSSLLVLERSMEQVDLNLIVRGILDDLEVLTAEKGAKVNVAGLPVIRGSAVLLNQLFYNLINNALKFSRHGVAPVVEIRSSVAKGDDLDHADARRDLAYACIIVADNGIGFDHQYADRIFEAFARLNAKDKFEGTGLGLALCKKIVERHDGYITASGKPDEGAVFSIWLPVE